MCDNIEKCTNNYKTVIELLTKTIRNAIILQKSTEDVGGEDTYGRYRKISILGMILSVMLYIALPIPTYASDISNSDTKAVVFLLDASGSMKTNDPQRYAIDSIAQLIYTLPSNYEYVCRR